MSVVPASANSPDWCPSASASSRSPAAQQVGPRLQAAADGGQIGRLAVADRDHELWAGEDVHLTELAVSVSSM